MVLLLESMLDSIALWPGQFWWSCDSTRSQVDCDLNSRLNFQWVQHRIWYAPQEAEIILPFLFDMTRSPKSWVINCANSKKRKFTFPLFPKTSPRWGLSGLSDVRFNSSARSLLPITRGDGNGWLDLWHTRIVLIPIYVHEKRIISMIWFVSQVNPYHQHKRRATSCRVVRMLRPISDHLGCYKYHPVIVLWKNSAKSIANVVSCEL